MSMKGFNIDDYEPVDNTSPVSQGLKGLDLSEWEPVEEGPSAKKASTALPGRAPEEEGLLKEFGKTGMRGAYGVGEMFGNLAKFVDYDTGKAITDWANKGADEYAMGKESSESLVKRGVLGGVESMPASVAAGAPGALAGATIGSFGGPLGTWLGGAIGYGASGGTVMGLAEYQNYLDEYRKATGKDPDFNAKSMAVLSALAEGGFEGISNFLEGLTLGAGRGVVRPAATTLKEILKTPLKSWAKRFVAIEGIESATEAATAYSQALTRQAEGLPTMEPLEAAKEAILPAMTMGGMFTLGGAGLTRLHRRNMEKNLTDPSVAPQDRAKAVDYIADLIDVEYGDMGRVDTGTVDGNGNPIYRNEIADLWRKYGIERILAGEPINLDFMVDRISLEAELLQSEIRHDLDLSPEDLGETAGTGTVDEATAEAEEAATTIPQTPVEEEEKTPTLLSSTEEILKAREEAGDETTLDLGEEQRPADVTELPDLSNTQATIEARRKYGNDTVVALQKAQAEGKTITLEEAMKQGQEASDERAKKREKYFSEEEKERRDKEAKEKAEKEQSDRDTLIEEAGTLELGTYVDSETGATFRLIKGGMIHNVNPNNHDDFLPYGTIAKGKSDQNGVGFVRQVKNGTLSLVAKETPLETPPVEPKPEETAKVSPEPEKTPQEATDVKTGEIKGEEQDQKRTVSDDMKDGRITTLSGRILTPPTIRISTNRKATKDSKRADEWLRKEAIEEAKARDDDYVLTLFKGTTPANLSQADRESMHDYLFGEEKKIFVLEEEKPETKTEGVVDNGEEVQETQGTEGQIKPVTEEGATPKTPPKKPKKAAPSSSKEPWQMTRDEYTRWTIDRDIKLQGYELEGAEIDFTKEHGNLLAQALKEGKDVPDHVLKEYPGLNKPGQEAPRKSGRESWRMTQEEFVGNATGEGIRTKKLFHEIAVKNALEEGEPVPAEVLKDYPELQPGTQTEERAKGYSGDVYHASIVDFEGGLDDRWSRGDGSHGAAGFYLTDDLNYAKDWGEARSKSEGKPYHVIRGYLDKLNLIDLDGEMPLTVRNAIDKELKTRGTSLQKVMEEAHAKSVPFIKSLPGDDIRADNIIYALDNKITPRGTAKLLSELGFHGTFYKNERKGNNFVIFTAKNISDMINVIDKRDHAVKIEGDKEIANGEKLDTGTESRTSKDRKGEGPGSGKGSPQRKEGRTAGSQEEAENRGTDTQLETRDAGISRPTETTEVTAKTQSELQSKAESKEPPVTVTERGKVTEISSPAGERKAKKGRGLTLKEQKRYLIDEIDKAIKEAPEDTEIVYKKEPLEYRQIIDTDQTPCVIINVPDDGDFTIPNHPEFLKRFKEVVKKDFPSSETIQKGHRPSLPSLKPKGKRITGEGIEYYNPYKPREQGLVPGKDRTVAGVYYANYQVYFDGFYSDGQYAVKVEQPSGVSFAPSDKSMTIKGLIPSNNTLQPAKFIHEYKNMDDDEVRIHVVGENGNEGIFQPQFIDSILSIYSKAKMYVQKEAYGAAAFKDGDKVVGLVMPSRVNFTPSDIMQKRMEELGVKTDKGAKGEVNEKPGEKKASYAGDIPGEESVTMEIDPQISNGWKAILQEAKDNERKRIERESKTDSTADDTRSIGADELSRASGLQFRRFLDGQVQGITDRSERRKWDSVDISPDFGRTSEFSVAEKYFRGFGYSAVPITRVTWGGCVNHETKTVFLGEMSGDNYAYFMTHEASHILTRQNNKAALAVKDNVNLNDTIVQAWQTDLGVSDDYIQDEITASIIGGLNQYIVTLNGLMEENIKNIVEARKTILDASSKEPKRGILFRKDFVRLHGATKGSLFWTTDLKKALSRQIGKFSASTGVKIEIIQNNYGFPRDFIERAGGSLDVENDVIRGAYDSRTNTVYIVADAIDNVKMAEHVIIEEIVGHKGLKALLKPLEMSMVRLSVYDQFKDTPMMRELAREYRFDTGTLTGRAMAGNEFMVHHMPSIYEKPSIMNKLTSFIRRALRKIGFTVQYSGADIRVLMNRAWENMRGDKAQLKGEGGIFFHINAFHGGPFRFDRFSTDRIGTGEGAQVFGWGLYFTDKEDIARYYAQKLGDNSDLQVWKIGGKRVTSDEVEFDTILNALANGRSKERIIADWQERIRLWEKQLNTREDILDNPFRNDRAIQEAIETGKRAIEFAESITEPVAHVHETNRNLYAVTLHKGKTPGEYRYMDWDKPIGKGIAKVLRSALPEDFIERYEEADSWSFRGGPAEMWTGKEAYRVLEIYAEESPLPGDTSDGGNPQKEASLFLLRNGIDGIRYPSGSLSGNKGDGFNYVVFDENAVTIEDSISFRKGIKVSPELQKDLDRNSEKAASPEEAYHKSKSFKERLKESLGSDIGWFVKHFYNPFFKGQKIPAWKRAVDISENRRENRTELNHQYFGMSRDFYGLQGESLRKLEKVLIEGDATLPYKHADMLKEAAVLKEGGNLEGAKEMREKARQLRALNRYSDEELKEGVTVDGGEKIILSDKEIEIYKSIRSMFDRMHNDWYVNQMNLLLRRYANEPWFEPFVEIYSQRDTTPEMAKLWKTINRFAFNNYKGKKDKTIQKKRQADIAVLADHFGDTITAADLVNMAKAYRDNISTMNQIRKARNRLGKWIAYFPRVRGKGKYYLNVYEVTKDVNEETGEETERRSLIFNTTFRNAQEGEKLEKEILSELKGTNVTVELGEVKRESEQSFVGASDMNLQRLLDNAISRMKGAKGVDPDTLKSIKGSMIQAISNELKARGFAQHSIRRKWKLIKGYETTGLQKVLRDYITGFTGMSTKQEAAIDFLDLMQTIDRKQTNLYEDISKYARDMLRNQEALDRISGKARGYAFIWYLGANIRPMLLQLTQNFVTGMPFLGEKMREWGIKGTAEKPYIKAMIDAARTKIDSTTGEVKGKALNKWEKQMIKEMLAKGIAEDQYIQEITGQMRSKVGRAYDKALYYLSYPFSQMEIFNRKSAGLAMFRMAWDRYSNTVKDEEERYQKAFDDAKEYIYKTHYAYGKENMPRVATGGGVGSALIARTGLTFRSFTHNYLLSLINSGDWKTIAHSLAYVAIFGGLLGLPLVSDVLDLLEKWTGKSYKKSAREVLRKFGGRTLETFGMHGLPALAGANISGSMAIGLPPPISMEHFNDVFGVMEQLLWEKPNLAFASLKRGDYYRAVENIAPEFVGNPMKAYRMATTGATTQRGKRLFDEHGRPVKLSASEAAIKTVGFNPSEYSAKNEAQRSASNIQEYFSDWKTNIYESYRVARLNRNVKAQNDAMKDIRKFNQAVREKGAQDLVSLIKLSNVVKAAREKQTKKQRRESRFKRDYVGG